MSEFEVIKKYIDEYDYYGLLKDGAPSDEFDKYSRRLVWIINKTDTVDTIAMKIAELMDSAFGEEINPYKFVDLAQKIKNVL